MADRVGKNGSDARYIKIYYVENAMLRLSWRNLKKTMGVENGAKSNGKAIASLVLGIISLVLIFTGYGTIVGIIAGTSASSWINARKENPSGMATAGIVLSIIGLAVCAFVFVSCVICGFAGFIAAAS